MTDQEMHIRSLCRCRPEFCVRLLSKYPLATAFLRSESITPAQFARSVDVGAIQSELDALETELMQPTLPLFGAKDDTATGGDVHPPEAVTQWE